MNKSLSEVFAFCANFKTILSNKKNRELLDKVTVGIAPTYVGLLPFSGTIDKKINVIAQNVSDEVSGARTGQVAAKMLKDLQVKFCLIGHSEVRSYLHETNSMINEKIKLLNINNISPVLCIGETLSQFEKHLTEKVIQTQLDECLLNIDLKKIRDLIIAYEPI
jgi:triosephosphate isomerase